MFRRFLVAAVVVLALVSSATAVLPAAAKTNKAVVTHKLIVAVKKTLAPAAREEACGLGADQPERRRSCRSSWPRRASPVPFSIDNRGLYRVKAVIDSSCKGSCAASVSPFRLGQPQAR